MKKYYLLAFCGMSLVAGASSCQRAAFQFQPALAVSAATATSLEAPAARPEVATAATTVDAELLPQPAVVAASALVAASHSTASSTSQTAPAPAASTIVQPEQAAAHHAVQRAAQPGDAEKNSKSRTIWIIVLVGVALALLRLVLA